jgi:hypothetical protein
MRMWFSGAITMHGVVWFIGMDAMGREMNWWVIGAHLAASGGLLLWAYRDRGVRR